MLRKIHAVLLDSLCQVRSTHKGKDIPLVYPSRLLDLNNKVYRLYPNSDRPILLLAISGALRTLQTLGMCYSEVHYDSQGRKRRRWVITEYGVWYTIVYVWNQQDFL